MALAVVHERNHLEVVHGLQMVVLVAEVVLLDPNQVVVLWVQTPVVVPLVQTYQVEEVPVVPSLQVLEVLGNQVEVHVAQMVHRNLGEGHEVVAS